jgi:hypothetical protein
MRWLLASCDGPPIRGRIDGIRVCPPNAEVPPTSNGAPLNSEEPLNVHQVRERPTGIEPA